MSTPNIPNHIREGIESAISRGRADDLKSTDSFIKTRKEFRDRIPLWMHDCSRDDFSYHCGVAKESFRLPGGEIIMVCLLSKSDPFHVTWWHHTNEKYIKADTIDHAIYCATQETEERMVKRARMILDAQEESA